MKKGNNAHLQVNKVLMLSHLPSRDDIIDTLLVQELAKKRNMVWKGSVLANAREQICSLKPDIVIMPEIRCPFTARMTNLMTEWGIQVVIKRCEAGANETMLNAMPECDRITLFGQYPYEAALEIVWGDEFANILKRERGLKNVKAVGALVFDPYFLPKPPIEKEEDKPTMLWATGFVYADRHPDYCAPEVPMGDPRHRKWWRQCREGRWKYIDAIKELYIELKDQWHFAIRLKPGESPQDYQALLGNSVKFCLNEPTVASLMRCDLVIHAGSTMAYEAHIMGIPTISYWGYPVIGYEGKTEEYLPLHIAPQTQTMDELGIAIAMTPLGKSNANLDIIKQLETEYYGKVDGKAHKRAAAAINQVKIKPTKIPDMWPEDPKGSWPIVKDVFPTIETWNCNACHKPFFVLPGHDMRPCPQCGVSLVRLPSPNVPK